MAMIREVHEGDWCVRLDMEGQVLKLDAPDDADTGAVFPELSRLHGGAVSAAALLLKAKQFDDGLMAAVDLAAQNGKGAFRAKAALLRGLAKHLADPFDATERTAATIIFAACELGGIPVPATPTLHPDVRELVKEFLQDEGRSKPIGFYTWTPELTALFRQDRFLQTEMSAKTAAAISQALDRIPHGWDSYDACLRQASRMTNPLVKPGLRDKGDNPILLPPSRSREGALAERVLGNRPVPAGFDLMTELIRRMRKSGSIPVPDDNAGWYEHQTWSLEPLVLPERMPESVHLEFDQGYRRHLEDLFRGALALARETHAKQVMMGGCGGFAGQQRPRIWVRPGLTVEPLPGMYSRRAACYRFVRNVIVEAFGSDALLQLRRLTPDGTSDRSLADELGWMETLLEGAAATSRRELGMGSSSESDNAVRQFADWRARLATDADVGRDARMMVPVFYDFGRRKTKVWAVLGWRDVTVDVSFRVRPQVLEVVSTKPREADDRLSHLRKKFRNSTESQMAGEPEAQFTSETHQFAVPVMAEVYVTEILNRDEFRQLCDRFRTRSAILANLH